MAVPSEPAEPGKYTQPAERAEPAVPPEPGDLTDPCAPGEPSELTVHRFGSTAAQAPTLVLLHGLGDSGLCWPDAVRRWGGGYAIAALDALGHGESPRFSAAQLAAPDPVEDLYAATERTVERIVRTGGRRVVVIGHSMGGGIAALLGARRPDLVQATVLEEPAWRGQDQRRSPPQVVADRLAECRTFRDDIEAALARERAQSPGWPEVEYRPWAVAKTQVDLDFLALGLAMVAQPWNEVAAAVQVPSLVVTGDREVIISAPVRHRLAELANPHLDLQVLPNAGHCVRRDAPEVFHSLVDPWPCCLMSIPPARSGRCLT